MKSVTISNKIVKRFYVKMYVKKILVMINEIGFRVFAYHLTTKPAYQFYQQKTHETFSILL